MNEIAEIMRLLQNIVCLGEIRMVDFPEGRLRVNIGGRLTDWIAAPGNIGQNHRATKHLRTGTQVLMACPGGDPANAVILGILYSNDLPNPETTGNIDRIQWDDGTVVEYDTRAQKLAVSTPGHIDFNAGGNITLAAYGDLGIKAYGDLHLDGASIKALEGGI